MKFGLKRGTVARYVARDALGLERMGARCAPEIWIEYDLVPERGVKERVHLVHRGWARGDMKRLMADIKRP